MLQYSNGMWCSAGKFGGVFAAIPQPIVAAILCITFGMVGEYFLHLNRFQLKKNSESQSKAMVVFHWQCSFVYCWNEIAVGFYISLIFMCFCHSGDWNFSPAIRKHEYDPKSLCGRVLHIHGFISTSIFL